MFKIGEFSQFSRVSIKMLRHYDRLGLLSPARVDPHTGYRFYTAHQLPRLNRIVALKDLGFSLEQIGILLDGALSTEQMRGMLILRRAEIEQQLRSQETRLAQVEARLALIDEVEQMPEYDVVLRSVAREPMAAVRLKIGAESPTVTQIFEEIEAYVARYKARAARPPLLLYHGAGYSEQAQDVEVMVPVKGTLPANGRISIRELPGHSTMACIIHTGGYDTLPAALSALLRWIEANRYHIAGPIREVYLRFGADLKGYELPTAFLADGSSDFVTELQVPVQESDLQPASK